MGAITAEVVETGERRDGRGRRVFPRAQRLALIEAYRASGVSMAVFARRERINYTTFAGWMHRAGAAPASAPIRFASVKVPVTAAFGRSSGDVEVRLPDGTMLRGGRVADLAALIRALRT